MCVVIAQDPLEEFGLQHGNGLDHVLTYGVYIWITILSEIEKASTLTARAQLTEWIQPSQDQIA